MSLTLVITSIGDGVNDVAAMKVADVSVALLNGYGNECANSQDLEDERRRQQLSQRKIGSNRKKRLSSSSTKTALDAVGVGDSIAASSARVKAEYDKAFQEMQARARMRQQGSAGDQDTLQYSFQDVKDSFSALFRALKKERERKKSFEKGRRCRCTNFS